MRTTHATNILRQAGFSNPFRSLPELITEAMQEQDSVKCLALERVLNTYAYSSLYAELEPSLREQLGMLAVILACEAGKA